MPWRLLLMSARIACAAAASSLDGVEATAVEEDAEEGKEEETAAESE